MKSVIKTKSLLIVVSLVVLASLCWYFTSKFNKTTERMFPDKKASEYYSEDHYFGIVQDKFIDRDQHNYKTIIVQNDLEQRKVLFDFEIGGLYEFIEIGDSISKQKNSLNLRVVREQLDTIISIKIYDMPD